MQKNVLCFFASLLFAIDFFAADFFRGEIIFHPEQIPVINHHQQMDNIAIHGQLTEFKLWEPESIELYGPDAQIECNGKESGSFIFAGSLSEPIHLTLNYQREQKFLTIPANGSMVSIKTYPHDLRIRINVEEYELLGGIKVDDGDLTIERDKIWAQYHSVRDKVREYLDLMKTAIEKGKFKSARKHYSVIAKMNRLPSETQELEEYLKSMPDDKAPIPAHKASGDLMRKINKLLPDDLYSLKASQFMEMVRKLFIEAEISHDGEPAYLFTVIDEMDFVKTDQEEFLKFAINECIQGINRGNVLEMNAYFIIDKAIQILWRNDDFNQNEVARFLEEMKGLVKGNTLWGNRILSALENYLY